MDRAEPAMRDAVEGARTAFGREGAEVSTASLPVDFDELLAVHRVIMAAEAAAFHERRFTEQPDDYPPRITELLTEGLAIPAARYVRCLDRRQEILEVLTRGFPGFDILLTPAALGPAPDPGTTGNPAFNSPWSLTGLPTVTFPLGLAGDGLPVGVQLIGLGKHRDLFNAAVWCEDVIRRAYESRSD